VSETARLTYDGKTYDLPVITGSEGEKGVDITSLRKNTGLITLDPGYVNTGACKSAITFIDGEKGILRYRGYDIAELAEKSTFLETSWLLLYGELPKKDELDQFRSEIRTHTMLHEDFRQFYNGFPKDAHPMAVCAATVGALATFYPEFVSPQNPEQIRNAEIRLLAKLPTIAAYAYKHSIGQPLMYPNNQLRYVENFLYMMFGTPCEPWAAKPEVVNALDLLLILHADHEQNCSTSSVRLVGSSLSNIFAAVSSGINALWGPLHGGANQAVIEMLQSIADEQGSARKFMERAKDKNDTTRLMGFGHRVYKNYDPRARILKKACHDVVESLGLSSQLLEIAMGLEDIALKDDYFVSRKLYPNVDFYSGIIYQAIGIPVNMFTVMFAMGRLPGWISQWKEMLHDEEFKIGRPRQIYTGPTLRAWVPPSDR
jgi:citrate synthase